MAASVVSPDATPPAAWLGVFRLALRCDLLHSAAKVPVPADRPAVELRANINGGGAPTKRDNVVD